MNDDSFNNSQDNIPQQLHPNTYNIPYLTYNKFFINSPNEIPFTRMKNRVLCTDMIKINAANMFSYKSTPHRVVYHDTSISSTLTPLTQFTYETLTQLLNSDDKTTLHPNALPYYPPIDNPVIFDSTFESGNLRVAIEVKRLYEYDVLIRPEVGGDKTYQWFFFSIEVHEDQSDINDDMLSSNNNSSSNSMHNTLKVNIINMVKDKTHFGSNVPVIMYNSKDKKWSRNTFNVYYFSNGISCAKLKNMNQTYYTLSFSFKYVKGTKYYFSYGYPYTYTHLRLFIHTYISTQPNSKYVKFGSCGKTPNNNDIPLIVITDFTSDKRSLAERPCVFLTSRIHPGETSSSYVIQGVIEYLLNINIKSTTTTTTTVNDDNAMRNHLLKNFIFKIIPMINVDGVIYGNYRSNLYGKDLNRMWMNPDKDIAMCVMNIKKVIESTISTRNIFFYCDFHGHSNKSNFFLYGCQKEGVKGYEGVFMKMLNEYNSYFDIDNCVFKINPNKMRTGRAVVKNEYKVDLSYCLETSMSSICMKEKKGKVVPFTIKEYKKIGWDFCRALWKVSDENEFYNVLDKIKSSFIFQQQQQTGLQNVGNNGSGSNNNASGMNINNNNHNSSFNIC